MALVAVYLFWICLFLVFYSYIGYGILIYILVAIKKNLYGQSDYSASHEPEVTLIIPAYNEAGFIETKIKNTLELNYPDSKLKIIFISDGSTDGTGAIIEKYTQFLHLYKPERMGKPDAVNRAMAFVQTPIVIFCDANTLLNKDAIREIVKFYQDPKVGGVAGEKKVAGGSDDGAADAEGFYWKYESALKNLDSELHTVVGAAGELFSIRTHLFEHLPNNTILDDFVMSMRICQKGYVFKYEPKAYASELPSATIKNEQKRKIRISAGGFQSMVMLKDLLNIFKYPVLSFQYISHRVLRWAVCPFCLVVIFFLNIYLMFHYWPGLYTNIFILQVAFYLMAFGGWILNRYSIKVKILYIPYYFVFMNLSVFLGLRRFLKGNQSILWEKAFRAKSMTS